MKNLISKLIRSKQLYPIWKKLAHISKVGMNFWGGASFEFSGEKEVIINLSSQFNQKNKNIIFDVGANTGEWSIFVYKQIKNADIYSFEPAFSTFKILKEKTQELPSIKVLQLGLGFKKENLKLFSPRKGSPIASIHPIDNPIEKYNEEFTENISLITLDEFCIENKISKIDFLKIDVEGNEFNVLLGAKQLISQNNISYIQFEFGESCIEARVFFKDIWKLLSDYTIYAILPNGIKHIPVYSTELEVFCTANYLAKNKNIL